MKKLLLLSCLLITLLSCEDSKKASVKSNSKNKVYTLDKNNNSHSIKSTPEEKVISVVPSKKLEKKKYPKITQENAVAFLTEYGANNPETKVRISTIHGDIEIQLFKDTPLHRANFIYLVKQGYFNDTFFHRAVPNFIIQGGNSDTKSTPKKRRAIGSKYFLPYENSSNRIHKYGTVSGAKEYRDNPDKMSAPFEFFIFLGPLKSTSHLNGNYTIFGKVTNGMDIVEKIADLPADKRDWPLVNLYIKAQVIQ